MSDKVVDEPKQRVFNVRLDGGGLDSAGGAQDPLEAGVSAIQKLFEGMVQAAQKAAGPEVLRNAAASNWLAQVAESLDGLAAHLRTSDTASPGSAGELMLFADRVEADLRGSTAEAQIEALKRRLSRAIELASAKPGAGAADEVALSAGYFRAAGRSVATSLAAPTPTT